jgi:hypothetical protein
MVCLDKACYSLRSSGLISSKKEKASWIKEKEIDLRDKNEI